MNISCPPCAGENHVKGAHQGLVSKSAVRYFQMGLALCQLKTSRALWGPVATMLETMKAPPAPVPRDT